MIQIAEADLDRMRDYLEGYENALYVMMDNLPEELAEDAQRTIKRLSAFRNHLRTVKEFPTAPSFNG